MSLKFKIGFVPTGSIAISFKAPDDFTLPDDVAIKAIDEEDNVVLHAEHLQVYAINYDNWYQIQLTSPVPFLTPVKLQVLFDDDIVYEDEEDSFTSLPAPGKRRIQVLRQRIYELIFKASQTDKLDVIPYGDSHRPASIAVDQKATGGTVVEVSVGYVQGMEYGDYTSSNRQAVIPFRIFRTIDNPEDAEELSGDVEELMEYLMEADWNLNSFGLTQSSAVFEAGSPDINLGDRRVATITGSVTVVMRRTLDRT